MKGNLHLFSLLALVFALFGSISDAEAQDPKYSRMLEDLVDEKYERVLFRAIGFTEKENTKKHPEPYGYMARAYLKIHQSDDPELKENYPKALKESLKYCTKFIKKDKEMEYVPDQLEFIEELRAETIEVVGAGGGPNSVRANHTRAGVIFYRWLQVRHWLWCRLLRILHGSKPLSHLRLQPVTPLQHRSFARA